MDSTTQKTESTQKPDERRYTPIYVMMVFEKCEKGELFPEMGCRSLVGFRHSFEDAWESVRQNMCDIWETCYDYALIEEVEPCMYPASIKRWWFKFNMDTKEYEPMDEPEFFGHLCGIAFS